MILVGLILVGITKIGGVDEMQAKFKWGINSKKWSNAMPGIKLWTNGILLMGIVSDGSNWEFHFSCRSSKSFIVRT